MAQDRTTPLRLIMIQGSTESEIVSATKSLAGRLRDYPSIDVVGVFTTSDEPPGGTPADVAIVVGGDGSILRGCRWFGQQQIPIIGVNLGKLGFLADLSPEELLADVGRLVSGEYQVASHLMFVCEHQLASGRTLTDLGLNEVCVTAGRSLKMIEISLEIDGESVTTFSCDGLIVSTPVGSTAHNLSAGGPILRQELQAFVITPICPHTLTVRPIVDSAERRYVLTCANAPDGVMLSIDGQIQRPLTSADRICIRRSSAAFQLIRFPGHSYYGTLHRKLGWRGQLDYRDRGGRHS